MAANPWQNDINPEQWKLYKVCTCGGILKHKYRSLTGNKAELHILPNRGKFIIYNGTIQTASGTLQSLKTVLDALSQPVAT